MSSTTAPKTQNTNALKTSTMINQRELSLLEQLEAAGCGVDVDAGDPEVAKALPFKPHDMTSNQILVHERIMAPENKELVEKTIREMKGADWLDIHIKLTARFHALVIPFIQGRVLAQVSPRNANDKQKIIEHARKYRDAYNAEGVSNDRFCIKIPTTSAGVQAAAQLYEEGIRTLGTALFSLAQALAAAQAKMLSISPYFNEVRAHVEQDLWPDVEDPATQHPMAYRMIHIRDAYAKLKAQGKHVPLNKAASCITARECMAMAELGADQNTILIGPLTDLMNTTKLPVYGKGQEWQKRAKELVDQPHIQWANWDAPAPEVSAKRMAELSHADPLSKAMQKDAKLASLDEDYLADGVLDKYNQEDEVTRNRLGDAILLFHNAEEDSRKEIQRLQAAYV